MGTSNRPEKVFRVSCLNFSPEETDALGRLLRLLASSFTQSWELVESGAPSDLVVVNLDAEVATGNASVATRLGCSIRPKQHAPGTLHRPLRSYELRSALLEAASVSMPSPAPQLSLGKGGRFRLRVWPAGAADWSREWWLVMAALRHRYRNAEEVAQDIGQSVPMVRQCLDELDRLGVLRGDSHEKYTPAPAPKRGPGWRALTERIGQIMRFSR